MGFALYRDVSVEILMVSPSSASQSVSRSVFWGANEAAPVSHMVTTQPLSDTDNLSPGMPGLCEVDPAVTGSSEDPAVAGSCEVGPAETGLARSASCRPDGRRARVRAQKEEGGCALLLSDGREPVDLSHRHVPRAQWLRAPHPELSAGRRGGSLPLFSVSNTSTSLRRSVPGISSEPARTEG